MMSMEHRWNNNEKGKMKYLGKNLSQHHSVHHKSHTDCLGITFNEENLTRRITWDFFN